MTELVINDNSADHMPVEVKAGQLRANDKQLVLVVGDMFHNGFSAIYLKEEDEKLMFELTHVPTVPADFIAEYFPHVIENARITVDLNEV